jgi:hypothetical protein
MKRTLDINTAALHTLPSELILKYIIPNITPYKSAKLTTWTTFFAFLGTSHTLYSISVPSIKLAHNLLKEKLSKMLTHPLHTVMPHNHTDYLTLNTLIKSAKNHLTKLFKTNLFLKDNYWDDFLKAVGRDNAALPHGTPKLSVSELMCIDFDTNLSDAHNEVGNEHECVIITLKDEAMVNTFNLKKKLYADLLSSSNEFSCYLCEIFTEMVKQRISAKRAIQYSYSCNGNCVTKMVDEYGYELGYKNYKALLKCIDQIECFSLNKIISF